MTLLRVVIETRSLVSLFWCYFNPNVFLHIRVHLHLRILNRALSKCSLQSKIGHAYIYTPRICDNHTSEHPSNGTEDISCMAVTCQHVLRVRGKA